MNVELEIFIVERHHHFNWFVYVESCQGVS